MHNQLFAAAKEIAVPSGVKNVTLRGRHRLLLSDNPETLNDKTFDLESGTLWHDRVKMYEHRVSHRIYGWHANETGMSMKVGIVIDNFKYDKLKIDNYCNITLFTGNNGDFICDVGRPLAKAYLSNDFKQEKPLTCEIDKDSNLICDFILPDQKLIGFIVEFDVATPQPFLDYAVRVVATKNMQQDLCQISQQVVQSDGVHYRGSWSQADLECHAPEFIIGDELSFCFSNGKTDNLQTKLNSYDYANATANPGHYGAVYNVNIPIINHSNKSQVVVIGVSPRGGDYAGAVKFPLGIYNIPYLKAVGTPNYSALCHLLAEPGLTYANFSFMHAGAATLPLAINLAGTNK